MKPFAVELTQAGIEAGMQGRAKTRRGMALAADEFFITVRREGMVVAHVYANEFWKKLCRCGRRR